MHSFLELAQEIKKAFDAGDKTSLEKIAPVEDTSTASAIHAVGTQLIYNGVLYDVTAAIAVGDTLTVGTNISVASNITTQLGNVKQALTNEVVTRATLGAHNIVDFKNLKTTTQKSNYTYDEATGTYIIECTATTTSDSQITIQIPYSALEKYVGRRVTWSISTHSETSGNTPYLVLYNYSAVVATLGSSGQGITRTSVTFTVPTTFTNGRLDMVLRVNQGSTAIGDTLTVTGMMFRLADDTSTEYQPYAKPNTELTQEIQTLTNYRGKVGARNLFYTDLQVLKGHPQNSSGNWSGTSMTRNGLTWTVNDDFSVTVNGAVSNNATQGFFFAFSDELMNFVKGKTIKASGCPSNGGTGKYRLMIQREDGTLEGYSDTGNGVTYTVPSDESQLRIALLCYPAYGTYTNLVFKPMLCLEEEEKWHYEDFVPASKTNVELTKDDNGLTANAFANGAVNLLDNVCTSQTITTGGANVTVVVNSDKSMSVSGTVGTADIYIDVSSALSDFLENGKRYHLSGCPSGGNVDSYVFYVQGTSFYDTGSGVDFTYSSTDHGTKKIRIKLSSLISSSVSLTFKPMITVADMPNSDYVHYVPYAKSNKELTDLFEEGDWTPILYDDNSELSYTGTWTFKHYVRIGKFIMLFLSSANLVVSPTAMLQIRNLPFDMRVLGGSVYIPQLSGHGSEITIQSNNNRVYFRPNITTAINGTFQVALFGYKIS